MFAVEVVVCSVLGQALLSCPSRPQAKHNPTILSYSNATHALFPSKLTTGAPLHRGLSSKMSTLTLKKCSQSEVKVLSSTCNTFPRPPAISILAASIIKSKGNPHTWTNSDIVGKIISRSIIPFSHLLNAKR